MDYSKFEVQLNAKCTCGCMEGNRIHKVYRFPNNKGASVIAKPKINDAKQNGFKILLIRFTEPIPDNSYYVEDKVIDCKNWEEVEKFLNMVMEGEL